MTTRLRKKAPRIKRLDGVQDWDKTLDHTLWLFLRAGVTPEDITRRTAQILRKRRATRALKIPPPDVLEYTRVLTYWRFEPDCLDAKGSPRPLPLKGRSGSFQSLVKRALPDADASDVLAVLQRHRIVGVSKANKVSLLSGAFIPRTAHQAQFVAYSLAGLNGIVGTLVTNLTARHPDDSLGCVQRMAFSERFDERYLPDYDEFTREETASFLEKQDAWLKRHEAKPGKGKKARLAHVGIGVFGFRAR